MDAPSHLNYTPTHEWVRVEGQRAVIGITDYAQLKAGMILFVELPELNMEVEAGEIVGSLETVEAVEDILAPVSGKVVAVNSRLEVEAFQANADPYGRGWMFVIEMTAPEETDRLWSAAEYAERFSE